MNVVMIGSFAFRPKGTVSARAFPIARSLVRRGHRVTILMPPYDNPRDSGRVWVQDGVCMENMVVSRNDLRSQIVVPVRLARACARLKPDIVHVFKPVGYSGLAGQYMRWFSRRCLVVDTDDWEGRGGWIDINPYPVLWRWLFCWQERWLACHADAVTVASRTLETQVWGFGVDRRRVTYLPNGPDASLRQMPDVTTEAKAGIRSGLGVGDAPLALYLGHVPRSTDLDLAVDAWKGVLERLPEARLVVAGSGDGLPAIQEQAQAAGIGEQVLFPGWIEHERAPLYIATADVVVNPYRDTLINRAKCAGKVVAAMALGKAVVTARLGQNLEYIVDGFSGLLTEPGDAAELSQALLRVLSNREWTQALGREAQRSIWDRFNWDVRIGEVERAYETALARS